LFAGLSCGFLTAF